MLHMIGIGLWDARDITLKGLDAIKKCSKVYLECYTSALSSDKSDLEKLYGKRLLLADRLLVEDGKEILDSARTSDTALLVIGDVFAATTHIDLLNRCREQGIAVQVIHNASVLTAVGETGLELYKFGKVTSIPFHNKDVKSPIDAYRANSKIGLHSLFLLDLDPPKKRFMTNPEAARYLISRKVNGSTLAVGCAGLGSPSPQIMAGPLSMILEASFSLVPQCLIIPGKLHFMEEEALDRYKVL
jgi:diphthine methyl ester synthase